MRFTIKSLMLVIAFSAGLLALYTQLLSTYIPPWLLAIPCLILLAGRCLWSWRYRRVAAIGFGGLSILINCLYVIASTYPDYMFMPVLKVAWIIVLLPMIGALGTAWAALATQNSAVHKRSPTTCWSLVVVLAILPEVTIATLWPLRLAFMVVSPG